MINLNNQTVLIVGSNIYSSKYIPAILKQNSRVSIIKSTSCNEAVNLIHLADFIIVDDHESELKRLKFLDCVRNIECYQDLPIIFLMRSRLKIPDFRWTESPDTYLISKTFSKNEFINNLFSTISRIKNNLVLPPQIKGLQ